MESPGGVEAEKTPPEKPRGGEEDSRQPETQPPSLFPLFAVSNPPSFPTPTSSTGDPQWLCNTSFTADVSAFSSLGGAPVTSSFPDDSDEEEAAAGQAPPPKPPSYEPVGSSSTSSEEDRNTKKPKERNKKKRKKRRREGGGPHEDASRKSGVRAWAGSDTKPAKDYLVDVRGDRDNLAFGSLYRMDVARYRLQNRTEISGPHFHLLYRWRSCLDADGDLDLLDSKLRAGGRYFSAKYVSLERHKGFRHVKVVGKKPLVTPGEFIPLVEIQTSTENSSDGSLANGELEESWEDEVLRRTRDFNRLSREFPHDEKVWLAFADFQDKLASMQPKKAASLQRLEKKISILEKAVELNPSSEELLVCLLKSYQRRDSNEVLIERWEKVLMQHSSSRKLWKEFLLVREQEFSRFKVSDLRKTYAHAIQALSSGCNKLRGQVHQTADSQAINPDLVQLELGLVDIFINLCRFEWQTGHQELATGLFQAEIEYSLFCPSLLLSLQSKKRLFEHFWNGKGSRLGEDGAVGWSAWLEKEEYNKKNIIKEDSPETEAGWTGWMDPLSKSDITSREPENPAEDVGVEEISEEDLETEVNQHEDNVEELLKKLGINIDTEPHNEVKDPGTWNRWSKEESSRDYKQWMPVREYSEWNHSDSASDEEGNEQLSRVVLFEDVREYLFSLCSEEARFCLVSRFIDFYGGRISQWACTNNSSWIENTLSLEIVPEFLLEYLRSVVDLVIRTQGGSSDFSLDVVLGSSNCISRNIDMVKFLRNAILLCLSVFPRNYKLEEAVLVAEELLTTQTNPSICSITPSRALAKSLLKNDRQDLLLCGLYAQREGAYGNIDVARKIFDMALSSIQTLPSDLQENTPLLYFWYAEMEMAAYSDSSEPSSLRAIHILSSLGAGVKYTPFRSQTSALQLLKAHQGFKEKIKSLRSAWARGYVKDQSIALICSASLFESLTTGWAAGIDVIEEAFSMALPERRSQSLQIESLCNHYMGMFQKHLKKLKLSRVWVTILQALRTYPYNHKAFAAMIEVGCHYTVPYEIRRILDEYYQRKPSLIISLFALVFEFGKAGSQHRIHGLFERALANEKLQRSVILWRSYLAYEVHVACNYYAARRIFFRAIHACPWSKNLWLDGFQKLSSILTSKELSDLQEVMREKELHLRTDIYEILLQDEVDV